MTSEDISSLLSLKDALADISESTPTVQKYSLGDWTLQSGQVLPDAEIAYKTHGSRDLPVIIYPTWYSGLISDNEWLIGFPLTLSPQKYYIIIPALFGNSESTSPSNHPLRPFPAVTIYDNARAQYQLVTKHLGIKHVRAVLGWSMGAAQTYQWATQFPTFLDLAIPFCGAARCAVHNQVFLEGQKSILLAVKGQVSAGSCKGAEMNGMEPTSSGGPGDGELRDWTSSEKDIALRAFGRGYAGWGFSQAFYREELFKTALGFKDLDDFLVGFWEKWATNKGMSLLTCCV